jgi:1,2-diacylglycerol 3-alpha-glucosyltransferase
MSESLKIAFYTDSFLPAVDGVVVSILNFKRELEKRGHEVYIYASGTSKTKQMVKGDKSIIVTRGIKFKKYPQYSMALFPLSTKLKTMNLKVDINHAHTPFMMGVHALILSKVYGTPIVGHFHTLFNDKSVIKAYISDSKLLEKTLVRYSWRYARMFYNRCDRVAAPSVVIESILKKKGIKNIDVVPGGVDLKKFNTETSGETVRKKLVKNKEDKLVMYVGRLSREKNLDTLIKAASTIKDKNIRFAIVGTGPAQAHYQSLVNRMKLNDKIRFTGFVQNDNLPAYYNACDVFCIPSTFETQGVVSLEAMACDKPVVGADYLALKEIIKSGKNGEKFRPKDSTDCARKLRKVLYNIDSYKEMKNTAKRYSLERTTDDLLSLYKKVLNDKATKG